MNGTKNDSICTRIKDMFITKSLEVYAGKPQECNFYHEQFQNVRLLMQCYM